MKDRSRPDDPPPDDATGLPGLPTWGAVYGAVIGIFLLVVALLTALSWRFPPP